MKYRIIGSIIVIIAMIILVAVFSGGGQPNIEGGESETFEYEEVQ